MSMRGSTLLRRAAREHRIAVVALAGVLLLNVLAYAFFVYPLSQRVSNVTSLTSSAEGELAAARLTHMQAANLLAGRAQATERLQTFYTEVLPADLPAARQIASPRLSQLATKAGVETKTILGQPVVERDHILTRLDIRMDLVGTYDSVRRFVRLLEESREFVVIKNLRIVDDGGMLNTQLDLATYYKGSPQ
jgi:Tfp pilus assembly protein PilO